MIRPLVMMCVLACYTVCLRSMDPALYFESAMIDQG